MEMRRFGGDGWTALLTNQETSAADLSWSMTGPVRYEDVDNCVFAEQSACHLWSDVPVGVALGGVSLALTYLGAKFVEAAVRAEAGSESVAGTESWDPFAQEFPGCVIYLGAQTSAVGGFLEPSVHLVRSDDLFDLEVSSYQRVVYVFEVRDVHRLQASDL
jgi:hypothetical protein